MLWLFLFLGYVVQARVLVGMPQISMVLFDRFSFTTKLLALGPVAYFKEAISYLQLFLLFIWHCIDAIGFEPISFYWAITHDFFWIVFYPIFSCL